MFILPFRSRVLSILLDQTMKCQNDKTMLCVNLIPTFNTTQST